VGIKEQEAELKAERKRVRADVYSLGVRLNAGETDVRAALDAAIRRSDEIDAELRRLEPAPPPRDPNEPIEAMAMYGPPPVGFLERSRRAVSPPQPTPAPMYGPPPVRTGILQFLRRLFRK
jgi:hypothetical protein